LNIAWRGGTAAAVAVPVVAVHNGGTGGRRGGAQVKPYNQKTAGKVVRGDAGQCRVGPPPPQRQCRRRRRRRPFHTGKKRSSREPCPRVSGTFWSQGVTRPSGAGADDDAVVCARRGFSTTGRLAVPRPDTVRDQAKGISDDPSSRYGAVVEVSELNRLSEPKMTTPPVRERPLLASFHVGTRLQRREPFRVVLVTLTKRAFTLNHSRDCIYMSQVR